MPPRSSYPCCSRDAWEPHWRPLRGHSPLCHRVQASEAERLAAFNDGRRWSGYVWRQRRDKDPGILDLHITPGEWSVIHGYQLPPFPPPSHGDSLGSFVQQLRDAMARR